SKWAFQSDAEKMNSERNASKYFIEITEKLIRQFGLETCADTRISLCSGGQLKRLSIAQELVVKPDLLILDEPTTGLDSLTCQQLIEYLKELTKSTHPMTIVTTIHQPSFRTFSLFDRLYLLSIQGKCIYEGQPTQVIEYLSTFKLHCPQFYNPAEFAIEVACGDYGIEILKQLTLSQDKLFKNIFKLEKAEYRLEELIKMRKHANLQHLIILLHRSVINMFRDPWLFAIRFAAIVLIALFVTFLYGPEVGKKGGCPPIFSAEFDPQQLEVYQQHTKKEFDVVIDNCGQIYFTLFFMYFVSLFSNVLTFPAEILAIKKEKINDWYRVSIYYLSKILADLPFQTMFTIIYVATTYLMTNQVMEVWRLIFFTVICLFIGFISQSQALVIGSYFTSNPAGGVYVAPISAIPLVMYSGYFFTQSGLIPLHRFLMDVSFLKSAYVSLLYCIFGFDRCGIDVKSRVIEAHSSIKEWFSDALGVAPENSAGNVTYTSTGVTAEFVNSVVKVIIGDYITDTGDVISLAIMTFEFESEILALHIIRLIIWLVSLRIAAYLIIRWKLNQK
ncbi:ATP-binding cassette sub-family G member 4-like protein, partial [Dinothrombium tinctorium]